MGKHLFLENALERERKYSITRWMISLERIVENIPLQTEDGEYVGNILSRMDNFNGMCEIFRQTQKMFATLSSLFSSVSVAYLSLTNYP